MILDPTNSPNSPFDDPTSLFSMTVSVFSSSLKLRIPGHGYKLLISYENVTSII